jgi:hypothetical protein
MYPANRMEEEAEATEEELLATLGVEVEEEKDWLQNVS